MNEVILAQSPRFEAVGSRFLSVRVDAIERLLVAKVPRSSLRLLLCPAVFDCPTAISSQKQQNGMIVLLSFDSIPSLDWPLDSSQLGFSTEPLLASNK